MLLFTLVFEALLLGVPPYAYGRLFLAAGPTLHELPWLLLSLGEYPFLVGLVPGEVWGSSASLHSFCSPQVRLLTSFCKL